MFFAKSVAVIFLQCGATTSLILYGLMYASIKNLLNYTMQSKSMSELDF